MRGVILAFLLLAMPAATVADQGEHFAELMADFEAFELANDPIRAGRRGDLDAAGRWPDVSDAAVAERLRTEAELLERLNLIPIDALDDGDQINHAVMDYLLSSRQEVSQFQPLRVSFTNDSGFFSQPIQLATSTRARSVAEAEAWIARMQAVPEFFEQHRAWLAKGVADGFVQPALVAERVGEQIRGMANTSLDDHPLLAPLGQLPGHIDADQRAALLERLGEVIEQKVRPAYQELLEFFDEEYLASPRQSIGISAVPDGRAFYRALVRQHTTLETTPEAVHEQGLAEVARIRAEMEAVIAETEFDGSFADFLDYLRTDPRFYASSERELLIEAAWIAKRADDAMPRFFGHLPRLPYGVRPVPAALAPNYTTGRYWAGDLENGLAGGYLVNTYRLDQRPLYELPALTLHEAVPGHHHQIAIAQELEQVPEFRRNTYITAFGEGWALYTEHLGVEMGMYLTPYEHFGRLTFEMWRACRLVVDTGMHYFDWSREQAESCLLDNSALAPHNVRTEIERYISWPGQALAYKTGELLIRSLRAQAEERLGERFDLRSFHDHLLSDGAMPLSTLEARMLAWIDAEEMQK
jgi:uncharacterized protein (DUF885 family)